MVGLASLGLLATPRSRFLGFLVVWFSQLNMLSIGEVCNNLHYY
jgi:hypothetical protein